MHAKSLHLYLTLCDPMGCSLPGSSVHGILQARILEWVAISSSGDLPNQGSNPHVSFCGRRVLYHSHQLGSPLSYRRDLMTNMRMQNHV